jgi:pimeloyl-ACP methyl ester carboxylesterase
MMSEPRQALVQCLDSRGLHRMAYWEWGDAANPKVLVCVHGLTRQRVEVAALARSMCDEYRVVCPDVVGRGQSDWLADPAGYTIPHYVADMVTLLARLDAQVVDWLGTSMGGLIGLGLASLSGSPLRALVLNDVGPVVQPKALERIGTYVGQVGFWETLDEAADAAWTLSQGFGPHSREQWLALTAPQLKPATKDGKPGFTQRCDPGIAVPFRALTPQIAAAGEAMLWHSYDRLQCRTLLLRGAESDLLSHETALAMTQRGPRAELHEFAGVGHAPTLVQPEQIEVVRRFLLSS